MHIDEKKFIDYAVKKPWGYEYLIFNNKNLSIWMLYLNKDHSTSFHCHTKKLTGLICLKGKVEISFFEDKKILNSGEKIMIRKGLFHSSKSLCDETILLEIESPSEKDDLVRLNDDYGRENKNYESEENFFKKSSNFLWLEENLQDIKKYENYNFHIFELNDKEKILNFNDNDICIILNGNIKNNKNLNLLVAGDCLFIKIYKKIYNLINLLESNTKVLIIEKQKC
jgi:hypothetical protein